MDLRHLSTFLPLCIKYCSEMDAQVMMVKAGTALPCSDAVLQRCCLYSPSLLFPAHALTLRASFHPLCDSGKAQSEIPRLGLCQYEQDLGKMPINPV